MYLLKGVLGLWVESRPQSASLPIEAGEAFTSVALF